MQSPRDFSLGLYAATPAATACPPSRSHNCSCSVPSAEEQPVHHAPGPCPHPVPRPTVTARGQGFIRPAAEERIDELVDGDQRSLSVGHAVSPPSMEITRVIPCTSSSVVQASSRSSSVCRCPMMEPEATAKASALASTLSTSSDRGMPRACASAERSGVEAVASAA